MKTSTRGANATRPKFTRNENAQIEANTPSRPAGFESVTVAAGRLVRPTFRAIRSPTHDA
jgi:hypothetical protein